MSNDNPIDQMQAYASLYRKKAAVILAMNGGMDKDGKNLHFNYKFIKADDVKHEIGALFAEYGIALQMSKHESRILIVPIATKDGIKETAFMEVDYLISLCDCETGAVETSGATGLALFTPGDDKVINKCGTAALKYFLMNTFLIAEKDEDDPDSDKSKPAPQSSKRPAQRQSEAPAPITPQPAQTPVLEAHWSQLEGAMDRMYQWAFDTHKATREDVNRAIDYTGKTLEALTANATRYAVKDYMASLREGAKDFN